MPTAEQDNEQKKKKVIKDETIPSRKWLGTNEPLIPDTYMRW